MNGQYEFPECEHTAEYLKPGETRVVTVTGPPSWQCHLCAIKKLTAERDEARHLVEHGEHTCSRPNIRERCEMCCPPWNPNGEGRE
jgi:hypothetical protein